MISIFCYTTKMILLMVQKSGSPVDTVNLPLFFIILYVPGGAGFVP